MNDGPDPERLDALDARLKALKIANTPEPAEESHYNAAQAGWRMVTELVVGLLLGFGIGFGLDRLLGTLPFMLIIFTMLGLAAGIRTMMRTAQEIQAKQEGALGSGTAGPEEMYDDED